MTSIDFKAFNFDIFGAERPRSSKWNYHTRNRLSPFYPFKVALKVSQAIMAYFSID